MFIVTIVNRAEFDKEVKKFVVEEKQRAYYLGDFWQHRFQDQTEDKWDDFEYRIEEVEVIE